MGGRGLSKESISKKSGGKSCNRGCSEWISTESRGNCKMESDTCLGCVEGGGEDEGEDDGGCDDDGCDNDGCDNDGCESFQALFEGLPLQLTAVVGARLRPRLPAVSDLPRGGLNTLVKASKACGKGNTLLESASMRPALIALAFVYCLASADLISVGLTPL